MPLRSGCRARRARSQGDPRLQEEAPVDGPGADSCAAQTVPRMACVGEGESRCVTRFASREVASVADRARPLRARYQHAAGREAVPPLYTAPHGHLSAGPRCDLEPPCTGRVEVTHGLPRSGGWAPARSGSSRCRSRTRHGPCAARVRRSWAAESTRRWRGSSEHRRC